MQSWNLQFGKSKTFLYPVHTHVNIFYPCTGEKDFHTHIIFEYVFRTSSLGKCNITGLYKLPPRA